VITRKTCIPAFSLLTYDLYSESYVYDLYSELYVYDLYSESYVYDLYSESYVTSVSVSFQHVHALYVRIPKIQI